MSVAELLDRAQELGATFTMLGPDRLHVAAAGPLPTELVQELRDHKAEIIIELSHSYGDGQQPPLDRPLETGLELRRWYDHTRDPQNFDKWLDWAMTTFDPSEDSQQCP